MQILEKREDKICFSEASYALLIYYVKKEEQTLDYIKEVIGIYLIFICSKGFKFVPLVLKSLHPAILKQ